jgi:large subunit ribosomal protein L4
MVSLPIYDMSGAEVGKYEIDPTEIASVINKQLLHDVVVMYQANQRQGSRKTKGRSEVAGHKKKMYRQKGTGNARAGMRRTNIRRGGGHAFALVPRDYSYRLPKKAVRLATRMAIAGKLQDQQVKVIDGLKMDAPKTSQMAALLKKMGLEGQTSLLATDGYSPVVYKSARNIEGVSVLPVSDLNAYDVLRPKCLVVTRAAMDSLRSGVAAD